MRRYIHYWLRELVAALSDGVTSEKVTLIAVPAPFTWPACVYVLYVCFMLRCLNGKLSACLTH